MRGGSRRRYRSQLRYSIDGRAGGDHVLILPYNDSNIDSLLAVVSLPVVPS